MRWIAATALLVVSASTISVSSSTVFADCPDGSYPWLSHRGVEYCKRDLVGPSEPAHASPSYCSYGVRASAHRAGKAICKERKKIDRAAGS
jgi:hypothetical protein